MVVLQPMANGSGPDIGGEEDAHDSGPHIYHATSWGMLPGIQGQKMLEYETVALN